MLSLSSNSDPFCSKWCCRVAPKRKGLASTPKGISVNLKCFSVPLMLNKNLNASLSSSFTPIWRNAFSVSKEQTCGHSYSNHYIPEKPLQRGTSKHAIIDAVSQRLGLNTRVKHHGNLRRNCTLLYNWLVWHVEHTFSRRTLFFFFFERNIYFYLHTLTNRTVHYQYHYRLSVLFDK